MNAKEIAERLRAIADKPLMIHDPRAELSSLANELDPPRPEPGTVVWWQVRCDEPLALGFVGYDERVYAKDGTSYPIYSLIVIKPARILAPDEVAIKVPPVSEWPETSDCLEACFYSWPKNGLKTGLTIITRAEAERMEATE
jgi:hypothetical protein